MMLRYSENSGDEARWKITMKILIGKRLPSEELKFRFLMPEEESYSHIPSILFVDSCWSYHR